MLPPSMPMIIPGVGPPPCVPATPTTNIINTRIGIAMSMTGSSPVTIANQNACFSELCAGVALISRPGWTSAQPTVLNQLFTRPTWSRSSQGLASAMVS